MSADLSLPLLPGLGSADQDALTAICARRALKRGETLDLSGGDSPEVMFLRGGLMRAIAGDADSDGVLAGLIGPGDAYGLETALTGRAGCHVATALTEVIGFIADAARLRRLASERPALALALAAATAERTVQVHDELACHARHRIEQRLARLLLRLQDRVGEAGIVVTQDELAQMLAVQRTTVTMLANRLKEVGAIAYGRARIRIRDRDGLTRLACGCRLS